MSIQNARSYERAVYALADVELQAICVQERLSGRGPGGQHTNKNETMLRMSCEIDGQRFESFCGDFRSMQDNAKRALRQLRLFLACGLRGHSTEREDDQLRHFLQDNKTLPSAQKENYALAVGVLLDSIDKDLGQHAATATAWGLSNSQLIKYLAQHKLVWATLQKIRKKNELKPLRHPERS